MITIFEAGSVMFVNTPKRTIYCPFCRNEMTFYSVSPEKCVQCKSSLLDYINMLNNNIYKTNYHFGMVDESGLVPFYM